MMVQRGLVTTQLNQKQIIQKPELLRLILISMEVKKDL